VRLVQGSHIVVSKLYTHDRAYIFQNADGRIIFAIPYQNEFTLIGTTDRDYQGDPAEVTATEDEISYLIAAASEYFINPIQRSDVVWSYSGVRPLFDDGASKAQEATRDYVLKLDEGAGLAPLLSIFGGKITTYRRLAESALEQLKSTLPGLGQNVGWTAEASLPGGDFPVDAYEIRVAQLCDSYPALDKTMIARLVRSYGTKALVILADVSTPADLGRLIGGTLSEKEIHYLVSQEFAKTVDDVIWRRSKLGLVLNSNECESIAEVITQSQFEFINETMATT
jgi:glycerol-3-phosphate dehydrogenase